MSEELELELRESSLLETKLPRSTNTINQRLLVPLRKGRGEDKLPALKNRLCHRLCRFKWIYVEPNRLMIFHSGNMGPTKWLLTTLLSFCPPPSLAPQLSPLKLLLSFSFKINSFIIILITEVFI